MPESKKKVDFVPLCDGAVVALQRNPCSLKRLDLNGQIFEDRDISRM